MASSKAAVSNAFKIEGATIAEIQDAMARGETSAIALVDYYLDRIERFNSQLKAIISVNASARDAAIALDKERADGQLRGLLHGIPLVIKGQVRNPYNTDYTPGGSSGGTAVAITADLSVAGLGTDAVNSVRSPASACNIVGLKPTAGLVSRDGLMTVSLSQDVIGPMGRSVADVAALLEAIGTDDPHDPMTARSAGRRRRSYQTCLKTRGLKGKRLGIVQSLFGEGKAYQEVTEIVERAIATMEELGAQSVVIPADIDIDKMVEELSLIALEGKIHFEHYLAQLGEVAPVSSLKALIKTGKVHNSVQPLLKKMQSVNSPLGQSEYWQRLYPRRAELRQWLTSIFQHYQIDALVYPHQRQLVAAVGKPQKDRNGFLAAASGFPAIAVPAGFSEKGLPVGLELMAMPFQEDCLLKMAYAYEQKTQWRRSPNLTAGD